jgi:hypothetical protein
MLWADFEVKLVSKAAMYKLVVTMESNPALSRKH